MERKVERVGFTIPAQPKAKRVAAYARVSSGKDAMLHSLSAQVSYYSNLIQNHPGWLYCGVFADEALTGTKENRAEFQRLLGENHIEVYFEKENIWTLGSKGELLLTIMSLLAQEESRSIPENVTWGQS